MGEGVDEGEAIAPWLAEDEVVLWSGRRLTRTWLLIVTRVVLIAVVLAGTFGVMAAGLTANGRPVNRGIATFAFITISLLMIGSFTAASILGVMMQRDMQRRTLYVVTSRRAMQLIPLAKRVINRYAVLQPDTPVRVRFRWGGAARLQVGQSPSFGAQFGVMSRVLESSVDTGWAPMQACTDADAGADAARAAIAALG